MSTLTKRLRDFADMLDAHPELRQPELGTPSSSVLVMVQNRADVMAWVRLMDEPKERIPDTPGEYDHASIRGTVAGVHVSVLVSTRAVGSRTTREIQVFDVPSFLVAVQS